MTLVRRWRVLPEGGTGLFRTVPWPYEGLRNFAPVAARASPIPTLLCSAGFGAMEDACRNFVDGRQKKKRPRAQFPTASSGAPLRQRLHVAMEMFAALLAGHQIAARARFRGPAGSGAHKR